METAKKTNKYHEGVGRRKTAIARVRITEGARSSVLINERGSVEEYFKTATLRGSALQSLQLLALPQKFAITAHINGGGPNAQAEAMRHGLARALILWNPELRGALKKAGYLKRDPRAVERKHFGLKKARRAPQWSKR